MKSEQPEVLCPLLGILDIRIPDVSYNSSKAEKCYVVRILRCSRVLCQLVVSLEIIQVKEN